MTEPEKLEGVLSDVKSVSGGSVKYITTTILSKGAGFLFTLILTRSFGASVYGLYALGISITSIARNVADLGSDKALLRFVPKYEENTDRQGEVIFLSYMTSIIGGTLTALILILSGGFLNEITIDDPQFPAVLSILAINILVNNLHQLLYNHLRATDLLNIKLFLNDILFPTLKLLSTAVVVYLGYSILGVVGAIIGVGTFVLIIGISLLIKYESFEISQPTSVSSVKKYYNYAIPVTTGNAGSIFFQRADVIMVGFLLTSSAVGIYNVAFLLGTIIALPVSGVNQLFPPMASRLYSSGQKDRLNNLYSIITRWLFTVSLFLGVSLATYRKEILGFFGEEFPEGSIILILIIGMQLVNTVTGPSGSLLIMTDHQYVQSLNTWIFGISNLILNYFLIITYGLVGAAIATFLVKAALSAVRMIELWKLEGFFPYSLSYLKPVMAVSVAAVVMNISSEVVGGIGSIFIGGLLGLFVYISLLYLGLEQEDREILKTLSSTWKIL